MAFGDNWNGKKKAITFSYDDGITQDIRLIEILNKYNLKCTFNLNSEMLGINKRATIVGVEVDVNRVNAEDVRSIYKGHEIAAHTLNHPNLIDIEDEAEMIRQVEQDRVKLGEIWGQEVVGMAYPMGGNDDRVAEIIRKNTGIKYARTVASNHSYSEQKNLLRFNPTAYHIEKDLEETIDNFLALETDEPQLLYIWGHSYEFDIGLVTWEKFERLCKKLSGKADIFYGTNREVLGV